MDLDVVFLGTAASAPTAQRSPAAVLVRRGGERLLFDCGEGTQRQLQRSSVGLPDIEEIFLTHYHADHFLGLPGMLKTFALRGRDETPLTVYGPRGLRELFEAVAAVRRAPAVSGQPRRARAGRDGAARRVRDRAVRRGSRRRCARVRARRAGAPWPLRRRDRGRARRPGRSGARRGCRPGRTSSCPTAAR